MYVIYNVATGKLMFTETFSLAEARLLAESIKKERPESIPRIMYLFTVGE